MKEVMVKIRGHVIRDDADSEELEFVTEAKMYNRNGAMYLLYEETELSGIPGCKTRLRVRDDQVQMKRIGEGAGIGHEILFEKGKRFTGLYDTPYGAIEMEVLTNDMKKNLNENGKGAIDIDYSISLKGLAEGRNRLNITLM